MDEIGANYDRDRADYITGLRMLARQVKDLYYHAASIRGPADIMGFRDQLNPDDFAGLNADVGTEDVTNVNAFLDGIDGLMRDNPVYLRSLMRMAKGQ
jgi:hypothetical protein